MCMGTAYHDLRPERRDLLACRIHVTPCGGAWRGQRMPYCEFYADEVELPQDDERMLREIAARQDAWY